jgi:hypothetical protein
MVACQRLGQAKRQEQNVSNDLGTCRLRGSVLLACIWAMSLCLLAGFPDPAAANWSDDPERCDDANEVERSTAAWYNMCIAAKDKTKSPPQYLPSIDPRKLPGDLYSQLKAQCDASLRNDANRAQRCLIDMSLSYRAKAQCGAVATAPVDEDLRACMRDASVAILMREEPTVRSRCSSKNPGKELIDCVDVAYLFGSRGGRTADQERALNEQRASMTSRLRDSQTKDTQASTSPGKASSPPTGCAPGYGMKPTPGAFGAWSCQRLGVIFLTPEGKIAGNQSDPGNSAGGAPIKTDPAPSSGLPAPSQPSAKIGSPSWAPTNAPSTARAGAGAGGPSPAPRAAPVSGGSPNRQSDVIGGPSRPGGQDIRSYDSKQGAIVVGDGRKVNIKPMMAALEKVAPAAAKQPFVASPGGGLRLSPAVQRALVQNGSALRKVGGVELDVTFENLALLGVPEMRVTGPATLIDNPVMISLRRLVAAAKPYADSAEHWRSLPEDIRYLGGLGRVHGYVLDPSTKDVFIVGTPAISREARLDIDLFTVLMETVWAKGLTPGVSIDPMPAGSSGSDDSPRRSNITRGRDGTAIDWLAPMRTRLINLPSDALVSRIMLDADYEMKRINYGLVKVDFKTYVDVLKDEKYRPYLGRWWFQPIPLNSNTVRVSASGRVLLYDAGVQLLSESMTVENAALAGTGEADPLTERAAEEFTRGYQHLESSPTVKPAGVFALLRGITDIVTMGKVLRDSEVDYSVLDEFRRLPYRHLSGAEAVPTSYPVLTTKFVRRDGTSGGARGGSRFRADRRAAPSIVSMMMSVSRSSGQRQISRVTASCSAWR